MNAAEILTKAQHAGVLLWTEPGALRYRTQGGPLPDGLRSLLLDNKQAIIEALSASEPPTPPPIPTPAPKAERPTAATTAAASPISGIIGRRDDGTPLMRQGIPLADGTWLTESEAEASKQAHLARHLSKHPAMFERMSQKRGRKWASDMRQLMEAQR